MSRRRRTLLAVGLLALAVVGAAGVAWITFQPAEPEAMRRVEHGMPREQVIEVFGRRPDSTEDLDGEKVVAKGPRIWFFKQGTATIYFDEHGRVEAKHFALIESESLLGRFRRWLRWLGL